MMMIDESIEKTIRVPRYRCSICKRLFAEFNSTNPRKSAGACEEECAAKQSENKVRVFLPPPGGSDMRHSIDYWRFVDAESPKVQCAAVGHDTEQYLGQVVAGLRETRVLCKRCGVDVAVHWKRVVF